MKIILTLCLLFIFGQQGFSQASEKKINKSPAKELIIASERLIATVNKGFSRNSSYEDLLFYYKTLPKSISAYDSLQYYKTEIPKIDPKWKMKTINGCLELHNIKYEAGKEYYNGILSADKKFDGYEQFLSAAKDSILSLEGKTLYDYLTGADGAGFNLAEYRKINAEALEFQKKYTKYDTYKNKPREKTMEGLHFLDYEGYQGLRYYVQEFGQNSYNKPKYALISEKTAKKSAEYLGDYKSTYFQFKAYKLLLPDFEFNNSNYEITKKNYELAACRT